MLQVQLNAQTHRYQWATLGIMFPNHLEIQWLLPIPSLPPWVQIQESSRDVPEFEFLMTSLGIMMVLDWRTTFQKPLAKKLQEGDVAFLEEASRAPPLRGALLEVHPGIRSYTFTPGRCERLLV